MKAKTLDILPEERLENSIPDQKPVFSEMQALAEAHRCFYCYDAPCTAACPTRINVPEFIRKISTGNYKGSARTILSSNIFGLSCAKVCPVEVLCAGACVYHGTHQEPIQIGRLQAFSVQWAYDRDVQFFGKGAPTGKKVALIGGGPASLSCAFELAKLGHEPVVFEKGRFPGGLNTIGVAPYKLHSHVSLREIERVLKIGIEIRPGVVGEDVSLDELEKSFDALFLGVGLGDDSRLGIPGEDLSGCWGALALIEKIKIGKEFSPSSLAHAVILGGGNTAIDAARELAKLGVPRVTLAYRRSEAQMTGYAHEVAWARREGVFFSFLVSPVAILGKDRATGVRFVRMKLGEPDGTGRPKAVPSPGTEFEMDADAVVFGTGQEKRTAFLEKIPGLKLKGGLVDVDDEGRTSKSNYFAGGDCISGGKEVVNAVAEGKRAASSIDLYLNGGRN
ncbi:MAG: NAD(P)-dependent oxidoreductase [Armatimonadetes bacterium]|nr:NAD(P)-dependent oxidoreductase [Armatimonadota bacterium]